MLEVHGVVSGYAGKAILRGVSLDVEEGEIVAVIGHNGAGKSTLLKTIFGMVSPIEGHLVLNGNRLGAPRPREMLQAGVAYVPQGNRVFPDFSVREHLEIGGAVFLNQAEIHKRVDEVLDLLPTLRLRLCQRAATLSGGEKQLLALGTALILRPKLLLLDEPTLGLAPSLVSGVLDYIRTLSADTGVSALVVEQKVREVLKIARRAVALRNGEISFSGDASALEDETKLREVYL